MEDEAASSGRGERRDSGGGRDSGGRLQPAAARFEARRDGGKRGDADTVAEAWVGSRPPHA